MAKKQILCSFGTDIDSVAGWIGSYGGGDSPSDIQRGIFATEITLVVSKNSLLKKVIRLIWRTVWQNSTNALVPLKR